MITWLKHQWVQNPKLGFQAHKATCGTPSSKPSILKAWSTSQPTKNQHSLLAREVLPKLGSNHHHLMTLAHLHPSLEHTM